VTALLERGFLF